MLLTEQAVDGGNDGLVVLPDGTKYVSSVRVGTVSRIRPGQKAEPIGRTSWRFDISSQYRTWGIRGGAERDRS